MAGRIFLALFVETMRVAGLIFFDALMAMCLLVLLSVKKHGDKGR
jgi:hypothetical protein